jgi:fructokinase
MRIGVDLGGTKIEAVALGPGGEILARRRVPTPADNYSGTVAAVAGLVRAIEDEQGRRGSVGVGIPGAESPGSGLIKNANSTWLIGRPLRSDLSAALGRQVRLANDADCFALSEATDGAAAGMGSVFGVILGTGVGAGVVVGGRLLSGPNAIAGEWGHNPLPPDPTAGDASERPGPHCYCGRQGCIETFLSGPGLALDFRTHTGRTEAAAEIAKLAEGGDPEADACLARYEQRLARALATIINILDPDAIVLGGGLSNVARLYSNVPRLWDRFVFSDTVVTPLVPPRHGDSSGVRGAAWLWPPGTGPEPG